MSLPAVDHATYWRHVHPTGGMDWVPAATRIAERHELDLEGLRRSPLGRNIVLVGRASVLKLVPPFWRAMGEREVRALAGVYGRLSVPTPRLLAHGDLDDWTYVVMERIPGTPLGRRGELGEGPRREAVARLQGRLMGEIGRLPADETLRWDWGEVLAEQWSEMGARLRDLPAHLARTAGGYVREAGDLATGTTMLHGDVSSINLIQRRDQGFALVDWSDAGVGPADHELISPLMHQFRGDAAELEAFWSGHGTVADPALTAHRVMARSILKYVTLLPGYLADLPGACPRTWDEAARRFTRLD